MTQPKFQPRVAGKFKITATRPDGSTRIVADWFDNLILDAGLNQIGSGGVMGYCHVGSGSTAPLVSNTGLQTPVATTSVLQANEQGSQAEAPYFGWYRQTYRFGAGVAAGNLSEVGVGWDVGDALFSRALIKDALGDPTTITVLADETLDVAYEIRAYPPLVDQAFTATVGGVLHNCVMRASSVNDSSWNLPYLPGLGSAYGFDVSVYEGPLGTITQAPSGAYGGNVVVTLAGYANNSNKRAGEAVFPLDNGNIDGGIGAVRIATQFAGAFQISFSPKIDKTNVKVLRLNAEVSWARYTG